MEDRLVKQTFKSLSTVKDDLNIIKRPEEIEKPKWQLLNKHVVVASEKELDENPRSKPAKLRGIEKVRD